MKRAVTLMGLTVLSTLAIFAYQWWVVTRLGPAEGTDALFAAMVVPQLVLNVITGSLAFVLVPMLTVAQDIRSRSAISTFTVGLGIFFGALALVLGASAPIWVPLTVPGFSSVMQSETIALSRIQLIGMAVSGVCAPWTAAYQAHQRFIYPLCTALVASLASLCFVVITLPAWGVAAAAWGLVVRAFVQALLLAPIAFPWQPPDFRTQRFRAAVASLFPLVGGSIYYKTDQLVDRLLASQARSGSLSLLHLAQQIYGALFQVLVNAIAGPAIPVLSAMASERRLDSFKKTLAHTTRSLLLLGAAIYGGVLILGFPLLKFVFGGHKFNLDDVHELWVIMIAAGLYWMAGLWGQILSTTFYAIQDTRTPTRIGVVGFTVGIPIKIAGFYLYGIPGVVVGSGIFSLANAMAMNHVITHRLRSQTIFDRVAVTGVAAA